MPAQICIASRLGDGTQVAGPGTVRVGHHENDYAEAAHPTGRASLRPNVHRFVKVTFCSAVSHVEVFNRTDHMLSIEWTASEGWLPPRITPYQNLSLDPATCVFHYAFECFEGMKAYKTSKGDIRLFRPDKNMARLNKSSTRIALPAVEPSALIELISRFVTAEERFIPA